MFIHLIYASRETNLITSLYPVIARSTSLCVRACGDHLSVPDTSGSGADMLSTAFNLTRLILLGTDVEAIEVFWARTWPDWQRLLSLSNEANCVNSVSCSRSMDHLKLIHQPLRAVSHSVFLDLVIFLVTIKSTTLASGRESITHAVARLEDHLQATASTTTGGKLHKAKQSLAESVQHTTKPDCEDIRKSIRADMLASEKLRALRTRR